MRELLLVFLHDERNVEGGGGNRSDRVGSSIVVGPAMILQVVGGSRVGSGVDPYCTRTCQLLALRRNVVMEIEDEEYCNGDEGRGML